MNKIILFIFILMLAGCSFLTDVVSDHYDTLDEAREDRLFERGWLPDILPPSTTDIVTENNLDISTSIGEFSFAATDAQLFFNKISAGAPEKSKFENWSNTVADYTNDGFTAWHYQSDGTTWAFFCEESNDRCDYYLW